MAAEPITFGYITSKTVQLAIRRDSDGAWLDFNDGAFKAAAWVTPLGAMTELSGAGVPDGVVGGYRVTVDPAAWTDGAYQAVVYDSLITTRPVGKVGFTIAAGTIVVDARLDAAVATRLAPTVAGRTLDVAATGEAGVDLDNIHAASAPTTLTNVTVPTVTTLTNAPADSAGVTTLLGRIAAALTITGGKVDVNDKTGFKLASDGLDAVAAPADLANDAAARGSFVGMFRAVFNRFYNAVTQTATAQVVKSDAGVAVSTMAVSDDGATQTKAKSA